MRARKAQSATEFAILIAALLAIFLPLFYLVSDYGLKSGAEIVSTQIYQIGENVVAEARQIYFLGLYSKEVVTLNIPENILGMSTLVINSSAGTENYLFVKFRREDQVLNHSFYSDIPIITSACMRSDCFGDATCYSCELDPSAYLPGMKHYRLETVIWDVGMAVRVDQVYI